MAMFPSGDGRAQYRYATQRPSRVSSRGVGGLSVGLNRINRSADSMMSMGGCNLGTVIFGQSTWIDRVTASGRRYKSG